MARRPTRARTSGQPGTQPARWPRHAEWVLAAGTLLLLGLAGGRTRTAGTQIPQAMPVTDHGPILIRAASLHDPARRYRVISTMAGQVVERSLDGVHWQALLTPAFPKAAGAAAAVPPGTQRGDVPSGARAGPPRGRGSEGCPAAFTTIHALIPARSGPDIYVATAGESGAYLDGGCGSAIGGIFAIQADGAAAPLGHDGLPFDQDPVGRTIRSYDVRGILVDPWYGSILYVQGGAGTGIGSPPPGLYRSTDSGVHWREIDAGLRPSTIIQAFPGRPVRVYDPGTLRIAAGSPDRLLFRNDTGAYRSEDGGTYWQRTVQRRVARPGRGRVPVPAPGPSTPVVRYRSPIGKTQHTNAGIRHPGRVMVIHDPMRRLQSTAGSAGKFTPVPWAPLPAGWRWRRIEATDTPPPARQDAAVAWDGADRGLLVFGGTGTDGSVAMGDLWAFSPGANSWTRRASGPTGRFGSAATWNPRDGALLVFGGQAGRDSGARFLGDLWAYHPTSDRWSLLWRDGAADGPPSRSHAIVAWDGARSRLLLFGGERSENPWRVTNDLWAFTPARGASGGSWTLLAAADPGCTVSCPQPRAAALGAWDPAAGHLRLFGGRNGVLSVLSDTWTWIPRGEQGTWRQEDRDVQPTGRAEGALAFDSAHGSVIAGPGLSLADGDVTDAWADQPVAGAWGPLPVAREPLPPARRLTSWAWDDADRRFLLFGGRVAGAGAANDLWELAPSSMQTVPPPTRPHPLIAAIDEGWALDNEGRPIVGDGQIAATRRAGARYVRINFRLGNSRDWSDRALLAGYDGVVDRYRAAGIGVLGLVNQEATQSSQADWTANNRENGSGSGDNHFIAVGYVQGALVPLLRHFHDRIGTWELWNEPNVYRSCTGTVCSGGSFIYPSNFAALLRRSFTATKDPAPAGLGLSGITLIAGGLLSHSIGGVLSPDNAAAGYLRSTYEMGIGHGDWHRFAEEHGGRYPLDGLGQHLYIDQNLLTTRTDVLAYYRWLRRSVARFGPPPPSYMTEGAWTTGVVSQRTQAQDLDVLYGASKMAGFVPWTVWFELHDTPPIGAYYGLIAAEGARKRSFRRYQGHAKAR